MTSIAAIPVPPLALDAIESALYRVGLVAGGQHNLITWAQLVACGVPPSTISDWVAAHRLFRIHRGVYAIGSPVLDSRARRLAGTLACTGPAAIMGLPALDMWDFTRFRTDDVALAVVRRPRPSPACVTMRQSTAAAHGHVTAIDGVPVTTVAWTITDLGVDLRQEQLTHVMQQACIRRLTSRTELRDVLELRPNARGRAHVVAALDAFTAGSSGTRSFLEDTVAGWVREILGYLPLVNMHVVAGDQSFEVDIPILDRRLCIEVDGPPHDEPDQRARDDVRDAALGAAAYQVERFHWRQIRYEPQSCRARLRRLLT